MNSVLYSIRDVIYDNVLPKLSILDLCSFGKCCTDAYSLVHNYLRYISECNKYSMPWLLDGGWLLYPQNRYVSTPVFEKLVSSTGYNNIYCVVRVRHNKRGDLHGKIKIRAMVSDESRFCFSRLPARPKHIRMVTLSTVRYFHGVLHGQQSHALKTHTVHTCYHMGILHGVQQILNTAGMVEAREIYRFGNPAWKAAFRIPAYRNSEPVQVQPTRFGNKFRKRLTCRCATVAEYTENNGTLSGPCTKYFMNGRVKTIKNYMHGVPHGEFIKYDQTGNIIIKCVYETGKLHRREEFLKTPVYAECVLR